MTMTEEPEAPATAVELVNLADSAIETSVPKSYDELLAEAEAWKDGRPVAEPGEKFRWGRELWRATRKSEWWVLAGTAWLTAAAFFSSPWYLLAALGYFGLTGAGSHMLSARHEYKKRLEELAEERARRRIAPEISPHKLIVERLQYLLCAEKDRVLSQESKVPRIAQELEARLAAALKRSEQFGLLKHENERAGRVMQDFALQADERNRKHIEILTSARDQAQMVIAKFKAHFAKMEAEIGNKSKALIYELVDEVAREEGEIQELVDRANESEFQETRELLMRMVVFEETANRALQSVRVQELAVIPSHDINEYLKSLDRNIDDLDAELPKLAPATP